MSQTFTYTAVDFDPFSNREIEKIARTTEPQKELWLSCILGGDDANLAYNESISLEFQGRFDLFAFSQAAQELVRRHEALRSTLSPDGENLIIYKNLPSDIDFKDISGMNDQRNALKSFLCKQLNTPFDLQNGPLFRFTVYKLNDSTHFFTLIIHHLIGDGWSIGIILQDISKLYSAIAKGISMNLPAAPQISEYSESQAVYNESKEYETVQDFWINQYKENVPVLDLPLDFHRPAVRTYKGSRNDYLLDKELFNHIKALGTKAGCSLVTTLLSAFEILLYQKTGQTDIVVGLPAAGQSATGNYGLVGHCVNLLPLRTTIDPDISFIEYLKKRKRELYDAYDNQQFTFSELLKKINIKRDRSRVPLVPVVFNVDMELDAGVSFHDLTYKLSYNAREFQTFEVSLNIAGSGNSLELQWSYNTQLFKSSSIKNMMDEFVSLLQLVSNEPEFKIVDLLTTLNPVSDQLINETVVFPIHKTIPQIFFEQVLQNPAKTALVFGNKKMSYRELDEKSNQLANYLRSEGVKEETLVPICINRSFEMIIGILGIIKAGGAYVPIEPGYPKERISYILNEIGGNIVIAGKATVDKVSGNVIVLDDHKSAVHRESVEPPLTSLRPDNLLYVIYTSGSTGKPKGVMIEHRSLINYIFAQTAYFKVSNDEKVLQFSNYCFDASVEQIFLALLNGASLVLITQQEQTDTHKLAAVLKEKEVSHVHATPAFLELLEADKYPSLKRVISAGDVCKKELFNKWIGKVDFYNKYGPTEGTISVLEYHSSVDDISERQILPIGKAIANNTLYILDSHGNPCGINIPGELFIGGIQVARGYFNQPELTRQRFVNSTFKPGERLYKTGDLVKRLVDGNIEFIGRTDDQVKIRGYRIELGEIENILQQYSEVKQCVVIAGEESNGDKRLVGYIIPHNKLNKEAVNKYLHERLPDYMVPKILIELGKMPLTVNGKVDKKALPKPDSTYDTTGKKYLAPQTEIQKVVADIWSDLLGLKQISITDDFFELGGHSLLALKAMLNIEKKTGKRLPLAMLFENSTIEKLSKIIEADDKEIRWDCFVPIKTSGNKVPIYFIHGVGLNVLTFRSITKYLDQDQPVYGLQARGLNGKDEPLSRMEDIAAHYISEILKHNPSGPYALAGYSFGGLIAYEMAKQLKEMKKEVVMLGVFDTFAFQSDYYDPWTKKIPARLADFVKKVWCTFVLMSDDPWFIINYRANSMRKKAISLFKNIGFYKKNKDPNDFYVYSEKIIKKMLVAARDYKLMPFDGKVDLFRAKRKTYYLPDFEYLGWKPFALRGVNIHEVPGEHAEIFNPPNVEELAKVLQACLDRANGLDVNPKVSFLKAV